MQSMTGYGKETSRQGDWEMTVELRAVNHRFLDLSMRLWRKRFARRLRRFAAGMWTCS